MESTRKFRDGISACRFPPAILDFDFALPFLVLELEKHHSASFQCLKLKEWQRIYYRVFKDCKQELHDLKKVYDFAPHFEIRFAGPETLPCLFSTKDEEWLSRKISSVRNLPAGR